MLTALSNLSLNYDAPPQLLAKRRNSTHASIRPTNRFNLFQVLHRNPPSSIILLTIRSTFDMNAQAATTVQPTVGTEMSVLICNVLATCIFSWKAISPDIMNNPAAKHEVECQNANRLRGGGAGKARIFFHFGSSNLWYPQANCVPWVTGLLHRDGRMFYLFR